MSGVICARADASAWRRRRLGLCRLLGHPRPLVSTPRYPVSSHTPSPLPRPRLSRSSPPPPRRSFTRYSRDLGTGPRGTMHLRRKDTLQVKLQEDTVFLHPQAVPTGRPSDDPILRGTVTLSLAAARRVTTIRCVSFGIMKPPPSIRNHSCSYFLPPLLPLSRFSPGKTDLTALPLKSPAEGGRNRGRWGLPLRY